MRIVWNISQEVRFFCASAFTFCPNGPKFLDKVLSGKFRYVMDAFRERHSLDDRACFKAPRVGNKPGGSEEWVATESVLEQMHDELL